MAVGAGLDPPVVFGLGFGLRAGVSRAIDDTKSSHSVRHACVFPGYRPLMDEALRVLERLDRIEELKHAGVPAGELLAEIRSLLGEGEQWLRTEGRGTELAATTLERCRRSLAEPGEEPRVRAL